jgi:capsular exopolysaccharide synthesis family protein
MHVTQNKGIEDKEGNFLKDILFKYLPYWPLFVIFGVGCLVLSRVYLWYAAPLYETTATILIKDEKKGVDDSNLMEQLDLFGEKKLVDNEIEVIKSRMLMHEVVTDLCLYAPITYKGAIKSGSAYRISPIVVQASNPDSLIEEKKVFFLYDSAKREVTVDNKHYPLYQWFSDGFNMLRFLPNANYQCPEEKKPLYYSIKDSKEVTESLVGGLKVTQATKLASVIDLSLRDAVPKRSEDILNGLIAAYNRAAVNDKNAQALNTLKFINARLKLVVSALDSVESGIEKYKTSQGIVDLSAQGQLYLNSVGANDQKLSSVNVQLAVLDQVQKYVNSKSDQPGIVPSTLGVEDPGLSRLLERLYTLEVQYEGLRNTTAENNPILLAIRNEIDKIKPNILENISSLRNNLDASLRNLSGNTNSYTSTLNKLPQKERGLIAISRQQSIENGIYAFLLQKREETALSYNSAVADTRIVDNANTGVKPVGPKHSLAYGVALVMAIVAGAGIIAFREGFNSTIVFRSEIEGYTVAPVIGEIMQDNSGDALVIDTERETAIAEQFRQLRTSLAYIGINNKRKKLLVTSSIGEEGKSFVAANLAATLALTGKKVVLLEMDLRNPKLSQLFNVSREVGLSDYLIEEKDADHIIKGTPLSKNLFIIPAGPVPPNPSELILNGRLEELLNYLEGIFDYIIVSSSPVSMVTDAYTISPICDATLYIVRHMVTPGNFIKLLDENITIRGLKNLAIVFNGVKNRGLGRYGYGYGYGHSSNYTYEKKKKDKKSKRSQRRVLGNRK